MPLMIVLLFLKNLSFLKSEILYEKSWASNEYIQTNITPPKAPNIYFIHIVLKPAIYSSDLDRAFVTAQITGNRLHLQVEKRGQLRERNNGAAEGLTTEEEQALYGTSEEMLNQLYPDYRQRWNYTSIPGAETYNELLERVKSELLSIAMS